jgi:hypothetical protein
VAQGAALAVVPALAALRDARSARAFDFGASTTARFDSTLFGSASTML